MRASACATRPTSDGRSSAGSSGTTAIVRGTIALAHGLGMKVVAEGVELACSLRLLEYWQCDTAQGYLISRPLPVEAFEAWLAQPLKAPVLKTT